MDFLKSVQWKIFPGGARWRLASWAPMGSAVKGSLHTPPDLEVGGSFELAVVWSVTILSNSGDPQCLNYFDYNFRWIPMAWGDVQKQKSILRKQRHQFQNKAQWTHDIWCLQPRQSHTELSQRVEWTAHLTPVWLWNSPRFVTVRRTLLRGTSVYSMSPNPRPVKSVWKCGCLCIGDANLVAGYRSVLDVAKPKTGEVSLKLRVFVYRHYYHNIHPFKPESNTIFARCWWIRLICRKYGK